MNNEPETTTEVPKEMIHDTCDFCLRQFGWTADQLKDGHVACVNCGAANKRTLPGNPETDEGLPNPEPKPDPMPVQEHKPDDEGTGEAGEAGEEEGEEEESEDGQDEEAGEAGEHEHHGHEHDREHQMHRPAHERAVQPHPHGKKKKKGK